MTDLRETLADVTALIPRYSWEIMDEEQRDELMKKVVLPRYMKTTADGVKLGPTAWAELLGASAVAVKHRIHRLQIKPGDAGAHAVEQSIRRSAKTMLRRSTPEQIAELIESDPKIARNVARAAQQVERTTVERVAREQHDRSPDLVHRSGFNEVAGDLLKIKRTYGATLNRVRDLDLSDEEADALDEQVDGIGTITDWFHSFLQSGSRGFERDLEDLLAEGR